MTLMNKLIPNFEEKAKAAENINSFCAPLQSGANDARSDDTGRLKVAVADWLNNRGHSDTRLSAGESLSANKKEERGISHDVTGRLLCPIDYDWDDPQVRANLRDAAPGYNYTHGFFLRCLYLDEAGDPEDPEEGFLKGPLLVRAFRHIFTSPSSASKENSISGSTSRRRDIANTLHMNNQVSPRSIAYTATQLVFSLGSAREWKREHAGFHYPAFYNFIVDYLEVPRDETSQRDVNELLKWWNREVFPPALSSTGAASHDATESSLKMLEEARARRALRSAPPPRT